MVDLFRGLAAFAILIWHYQHFYLMRPDTALPPDRRPLEPAYALLKPLYEHGYLAVEFFWLISGFVFAAIYLRPGPSTREFVINRFARLYPLHLLTLLVVAAVQAISLHLLGRCQIYGDNSPPAFAAQLFMASNWTTQLHFTFNGPIWSVSVEILFYGLFWAVRPWLYRAGAVGPVLLSGMFWVLAYVPHLSWGIGFKCGFYFFAGNGLFLFANAVRFRAYWLLAPAALCFAAGALAFRLAPSHFLAITVPLCIVALLLAVLGLEHDVAHRATQRLRWVGDGTYGLYLWHLPLQVTLLVIMDAVVGSRTAVSSPLFLLGFVLTAAAIARLSFTGFEAPMRSVVRHWDRSLRRSRSPAIYRDQ